MLRLRLLQLCAAGLVLAAHLALAAEHAGQVTFSGQPVPGATVTATREDRRLSTFTNEQGVYRFEDLSDGPWTIEVQMLGFSPARIEVIAATGGTPASIALMLRPFAELSASVATVSAESVVNAPAPDRAAPPDAAPASRSGDAPPAAAPAGPDPAADLAAAAADGFLVNGSVNNGASTPFAQAAAFGNNRNLRRSLYNGALGAVIGNSAWDARPFSFGGARATKPSYDDLQILGTFGGPIPVPGPLNRRPNLFAGYQRNVDHAATTQSAVVPTALEREGDFSRSLDAFGSPVRLVDPLSGAPLASARLPVERNSPAARALLALYPLPNVDGGRFNYQGTVLTRTQQDSVQSRVTQNPGNRDQLLGLIQYQRTATDSTSLFGFTSTTRSALLDTSGTWSHRFSPFFATRFKYQFTRATTDALPHFARTTDVIGAAGIAGADAAPENWGPPSLTFAGGVLPLSDVEFGHTTTNTHGGVAEALLYRGRHSLTIGGGVRRIALDALGQQNGRGAFSFDGYASGSDLADLLFGLPRTASLGLGNADKALRARAVEAYLTDDWRVTPGLTVNAGVRWDFETPFSERRGRLANLDASPAFDQAGVVTPAASVGEATGRDFGPALLRADWRGIQPRLGVAWRPIAGSSLVVRAGYGIYRNTNTYQPIALLMAQQPPHSTALSLEATPAHPLLLATALLSPASSPVSFAVDPEFRIGSAHNWQVIAQRDLPASITLSAGYLGSYGAHLMQEVLPNTYPPGALTPCGSCPAGFVYLLSDGSSVRHAGQFQLRRRLRNGLQASAQYTIARATDNAGAFTGASLSGASIAQDWRNLDAERGPSAFDQRHLFTAQVQYTTGVGVAGGGLLTGTKGALVKGWTVTSQLTVGSGLPLTPVYLSAVPGTGVTGALRASRSGARDEAPAGYYLNPAAFSTPAPGTWGDAGRNSVTGPRQFSMTAGVARSFPWGDRMTLDWRLDATNVLNVVTYSSIDPVVGSPQFGLPNRANPMRKIQTSIRFRF